MDLHVKSVNNVYMIEIEGRFDAYEVPKLTTWFNENLSAEQANIIVDLGAVDFIDSSGLAVLVKGLKRSRMYGGDLFLCNLRQVVQTIIELTRLDKAFHIYADEHTALAAIKQSQG
jgi:anti-sigma B factor antagonist